MNKPSIDDLNALLSQAAHEQRNLTLGNERPVSSSPKARLYRANAELQQLDAARRRSEPSFEELRTSRPAGQGTHFVANTDIPFSLPDGKGHSRIPKGTVVEAAKHQPGGSDFAVYFGPHIVVTDRGNFKVTDVPPGCVKCQECETIHDKDECCPHCHFNQICELAGPLWERTQYCNRQGG
jgi:hypothetical protein